MSRILSLDEFLARIQRMRDRDTPFTWLIGAGMSISSRMPLSTDIGRRIVLFEYLAAKEIRPWKQEIDVTLEYKEDLDGFLDWYDQSEASHDTSFALLKESAEAWLKTKDGLQEVSPDSPNFYQAIFEHLLDSEPTQHLFLTKIVRRGKGVNIAHLALAGILRDYPDYGSVVFTTNFDDLLLQALLYLDHTARVYGDLQSKDHVYPNHTYPQIIHLHGRHTSVRLANTPEQMSSIDDAIKDAFTDRIKNSHLIVVGYSGWDDFAMQTLREWKDDRNILKGDLYWVPHRSEKTILPHVRAFLDDCPPGRTHIIVNANRDLNADMFMLELASRINRRHGGFETYRTELRNNALKQHHFTLEQLEQYPPHDPNFAVGELEKLLKECRDGAVLDVETRMAAAIHLVEPEDVPPGVKAQVYWLLGLLEMMRRNFQKAAGHLEYSLELRGRIEERQDRAHLIFNGKIHRALGESHLRSYNHVLAENSLRVSDRLAQDHGDGPGMALAKLLLVEIALREAKVDKGQLILNQAERASGVNASAWIKAEIRRLRGDICLMRHQGDDAKAQYELCAAEYEHAANARGAAFALKGLGHACITMNRIAEGLKFYEDARKAFTECQDLHGLGDVEQGFGDHYSFQKKSELAATSYLAAAGYYEAGKYEHGLANAKVELLRIRVEEYKALAKEEAPKPNAFFRAEIDEIIALCHRTKNGYAWRQLIDSHLINPQTQGQQP